MKTISFVFNNSIQPYWNGRHLMMKKLLSFPYFKLNQIYTTNCTLKRCKHMSIIKMNVLYSKYVGWYIHSILTASIHERAYNRNKKKKTYKMSQPLIMYFFRMPTFFTELNIYLIRVYILYKQSVCIKYPQVDPCVFFRITSYCHYQVNRRLPSMLYCIIPYVNIKTVLGKVNPG